MDLGNAGLERLEDSAASTFAIFRRKMRAFRSRCAELLPLPSIAFKPPALLRAQPHEIPLTEGHLAAIISSTARIPLDQESLNPLEIVEAATRLLKGLSRN